MTFIRPAGHAPTGKHVVAFFKETKMPDQNSDAPVALAETSWHHFGCDAALPKISGASWMKPLIFGPRPAPFDIDAPADQPASIDWPEEVVHRLHWHLLSEIKCLADPAGSLTDKLEMLQWIFATEEHEHIAFSFANCVRFVGCSPLTDVDHLPYVGLIDPEAIRDYIRRMLPDWMGSTLSGYPSWVVEAMVVHSDYVARKLEKDPQFVNKTIRRSEGQGDFFT